MTSSTPFRLFWLVWLALIIRLNPIFHVPKYAIVGAELGLLLPFYLAHRPWLNELFINAKRLKGDLLVGLLAGIVWAIVEVGWDHINGVVNPMYLSSLLFLPLGLIYV